MASKHALEADEYPNKRSRLDGTDDVVTGPSQADQERTVGITAFVSPNAPGFRCVVKQRYTDFLVNEILPDGRVLHLTDLPEANKKPQKEVKSPAENGAQAPSAKPTEVPELPKPKTQSELSLIHI